jgi:hypothetical protein
MAFVLIVSLPAGIALQNTSIALFALWLMFNRRRKARMTFKMNWAAGLTIVLMLWLLWLGAVTLLNDFNTSAGNVIPFWFGYLPLVFMPVLMASRFEINHQLYHFVKKVTTFVVMIWTILIFSQWLWGWSLRSADPFSAAMPTGFYSHPETLAAVSVLIWPLALTTLKLEARSASTWILTVCLLLILMMAAPWPYHLVALVLTVWQLYHSLREDKINFYALLASAWILLLTMTVELAILGREPAMAEVVNHFAGWQSFWSSVATMDASWLWFGHGIDLDRTYWLDYSQAQQMDLGVEGLASLPGLYWQLLLQGGAIGLGLYLCWLAGLWYLSSRVTHRYHRDMYRQTLLVFMLLSLWVNVFQKAEFRHVLTLYIAAMASELPVKLPFQSRASGRKPNCGG